MTTEAELPPAPPASRTTVIGAQVSQSGHDVIVVLRSKLELVNQVQASTCAVLFTLALCIGFLAPLFVNVPPLITAGEMVALAGGVITGASLARGASTRAADIVRPSSPPPPAPPPTA